MGQFSNRSIDIGVVLDLMIHDIDLCLSLTQSPITDVRAIGMGLHTDQDLINARIEATDCIFSSQPVASQNKSQGRLSILQIRHIGHSISNPNPPNGRNGWKTG